MDRREPRRSEQSCEHVLVAHQVCRSLIPRLRLGVAIRGVLEQRVPRVQKFEVLPRYAKDGRVWCTRKRSPPVETPRLGAVKPLGMRASMLGRGFPPIGRAVCQAGGEHNAPVELLRNNTCASFRLNEDRWKRPRQHDVRVDPDDARIAFVESSSQERWLDVPTTVSEILVAQFHDREAREPIPELLRGARRRHRHGHLGAVTREAKDRKLYADQRFRSVLVDADQHGLSLVLDSRSPRAGCALAHFCIPEGKCRAATPTPPRFPATASVLADVVVVPVSWRGSDPAACRSCRRSCCRSCE